MNRESVAPRITEKVELKKFDLDGNLLEEVVVVYVDGEVQEDDQRQP